MAEATTKKVGPMPSGRRWRDIAVPSFFQEDTAEAFTAMPTQDDDVFMCSLGKGGTTWVNKILWSLLYGVDDEGNQVEVTDRPGKSGQVYPDALPLTTVVPVDGEEVSDGEKFRRMVFGLTGLNELEEQPSPRLFSTHLVGQNLPSMLIDPQNGKGRLVLVLRNLKDVLVSLHFFRGEAKDGWFGNEHGPGSFARFLAPNDQCPNAYGSPFYLVQQMHELVEQLEATGRVTVVFFEALKLRLPSEIDRIADFLKIPLTPAKRAAVIAAVGFDAMSQGGGHASVLLRKGIIGDWQNSLTPEDWKRFDAVFEERLGKCPLVEPLRWFQQPQVTGMPPRRETQTINDDTRSWKFVRATVKEGFLVRDGLIAPPRPGQPAVFNRPASEFNTAVMHPHTSDPAANTYTAEAGRYHLFVSGVCPWATSVRAARHLLGLEEVVPMDVADGQSSGGWVFLDGVSCAGLSDMPGPFFLHQLYMVTEPGCTTRLTVPVLWDTRTSTVVSNDSWDILKMLATHFAPLGTPRFPDQMPGGLYPSELQDSIEQHHANYYKSLLNGVYRAGIGLLRGGVVDAAVAEEVLGSLGELDAHLGGSKWVAGEHFTAVDIRCFCTLVRFDAAYHYGFGLYDKYTSAGKGGVLIGDGYPNLKRFVREAYAMLEPIVEWRAFRHYFRWAPGLPADAPLPDIEPIIASASQKSV